MGKVLQGKYEENVKSVENIIIIIKYFLILTLIPFRWKGIIVYFAYILIFLDIYTFSDYLVNWYLTLFFLISLMEITQKRNWKQKHIYNVWTQELCPINPFSSFWKYCYFPQVTQPEGDELLSTSIISNLLSSIIHHELRQKHTE